MNNHSPLVSIVTEVYDKDGNLKQPSEMTVPIETRYSVGLTVKNAEGNIISEETIPFKSYTANFTHLMNASFNNIDSSNLIKIVADNSNIGADTTKLDCTGPIGTATQGIVIGFNTTTAAISNLCDAAKSNINTIVGLGDYALKCQILHHSSQFEYAAQTVETYNIGDKTLVFKRTFKNNSIADYDIGEVGFIGDSGGSGAVLLCRDTLKYNTTPIAPTIVIAGATLEVKYTFALNTIQDENAADIETAAFAIFTSNFLSMLYSDMTAASKSFIALDGTALSLDISANQGYKDCLAGSGVETWGVLVGHDSTIINPSHSDYGFPNSSQNTSLTHSATTAIPYTVTSTTLTNARGVAGTRSFVSSAIGFQRDFLNGTTSSISISKLVLAMKGSAAGLATSMGLISGGFPTVSVGAGETLKIKLYMYFPIV